MNPPETAPKDRLILADFGWPWIQQIHWCAVSGKWAVAVLQCQPVDGEWEDYYFETDYEHTAAMRGWVPMPDVARR